MSDVGTLATLPDPTLAEERNSISFRFGRRTWMAIGLVTLVTGLYRNGWRMSDVGTLATLPDPTLVDEKNSISFRFSRRTWITIGAVTLRRCCGIDGMTHE